jgi:hypothetical protein
LLGFYQNFPVIPHAKATFTCAAPTRALQEAIIKTANHLNSEEIYLDKTMSAPIPNCRIGFEFGIAEGATFNYLNPEEVERFLKSLGEKETVLNIDFLCVVKYYLAAGGNQKRRPLKFDHYLLRFLFRKPEAQLRIFHERGTQHMSIEELIEFLTKRISTELEKTKAKPLRLTKIMHPVPIEDL